MNKQSEIGGPTAIIIILLILILGGVYYLIHTLDSRIPESTASIEDYADDLAAVDAAVLEVDAALDSK